MTTDMMNKPLTALVAVVVLIGGAAGCGTSTTTSATGTTSSSAALTARAKLVEFAQCLRTHGVPHFPDPDAKGEFQFGIDVSPAVWRQATTACKDLEPPGEFSSKRTPRQQSDGLRFAACIRSHGVSDFPDPVQGQPLIDTTRIPSSNRPGGMTILNAAIAKCKTALNRAAAGQ